MLSLKRRRVIKLRRDQAASIHVNYVSKCFGFQQTESERGASKRRSSGHGPQLLGRCRWRLNEYRISSILHLFCRLNSTRLDCLAQCNQLDGTIVAYLCQVVSRFRVSLSLLHHASCSGSLLCHDRLASGPGAQFKPALAAPTFSRR